MPLLLHNATPLSCQLQYECHSQVHIADYLGSAHFIGATLERAGIMPDPSMAQIRQAATEFGVLPLGSQRVHERLEPHTKALLLYGHHDTGKKLLAHAIAHSAGAAARTLACHWPIVLFVAEGDAHSRHEGG
jgi:DNA replication protein DnaC